MMFEDLLVMVFHSCRFMPYITRFLACHTPFSAFDFHFTQGELLPTPISTYEAVSNGKVRHLFILSFQSYNASRRFLGSPFLHNTQHDAS